MYQERTYLLLFETFLLFYHYYFFFTWAISRGACSPKNPIRDIWSPKTYRKMSHTGSRALILIPHLLTFRLCKELFSAGEALGKPLKDFERLIRGWWQRFTYHQAQPNLHPHRLPKMHAPCDPGSRKFFNKCGSFLHKFNQKECFQQ